MAIMETGKITRTGKIKFKYGWTIHNFSTRFEENTENIVSQLFPEEEYDKMQWQLLLYPKGITPDCENFVSLFVQLCSESKKIEDIPGKVKFKFAYCPTKVIPIRKHREDDHLLGFDKFIERNVMLDKLIDDKLMIFCEVSTEINSIQHIPCRSRLADDFDSLFDYRDFNDVTLSVDRRKLKAHKAILGARSPVFKAMFNHDMEENLTNDVKIEDVKYEVLKELLRYIYTEKVQNLEKVKMGLMIAADKYQLEDLKTICEKALLSMEITLENIFEIFVTAEKHRAYLLKTAALNYIRTNAEKIIIAPGWKKISEEYPDLIQQAFCALTEKCSTITYLK